MKSIESEERQVTSQANGDRQATDPFRTAHVFGTNESHLELMRGMVFCSVIFKQKIFHTNSKFVIKKTHALPGMHCLVLINTRYYCKYYSCRVGGCVVHQGYLSATTLQPATQPADIDI